MANANRLDATFFAFRKREKGGVLLSTSIAFLVLLAVIGGAVAALVFTQLQPVITWYSELMVNAADPAALQSMGMPEGLGLAVLIYFVTAFVFCLAFAAYEAACLRWMIRGEREGFFGLSLNADTWRVYGGYWMWLLVIIGLYIGIIILGAVAAMAGGIAAGDSPGFMIFVVGLVPILVLGVFTYFLVRLAPAAATSIARQKFSFFEAWSVTKGRFWALFGAMILLWLIYMVCSTILTSILMTAILAGSGVTWTSMFTDPVAFNEAYYGNMATMFSSPANIAFFVGLQLASWIVALVFSVMLFGVNARAAIAAVEEGKINGVLPEVARTFD